MKIKYLIYALIFLQIFSCKKENEHQDVKFRARIINARTDKVLVSRDFLFMNADTLPIIQENEIKGFVRAPEEGLYFIYIYPEFQTVYLKPGDSLSFHININEFDESLSFSGNLGFENNLLMELYLINEKESNYFYQKKFDFEPETFIRKIDSFSLTNQLILDKYKKELKNTTRKYQSIVNLWEKSLEYNLKEAYLKKHQQEKLPDNYTGYHQVLQQKFPDPNIIYMYAFVENYINRKIPEDISRIENWYLQTAHIIQQDIADPSFKNNLLVKYCYRYIKEKKLAQNDSVSKYFIQHIDNEEYQNYCLKHIAKNNRLQTGKTFPDIELMNPQQQIFHSSEIFKNKKVLLSFWDLKRRKNFISNLNKLKNIRKKHPELKIIIINTDSHSHDEWILQLPVDTRFQYFQTTRIADNEIINPYHPAQVYLIENDTIKASMVNMYATDFEKKLENFLNEEK